MIEYSIESFSSVREELKEYNQTHWEEASFLAAEFPCEPDDESSELLSNLGVLHFVTARDNGRLVGYMSFSVHRHPHSRELLVAHNERVFVKKEYRKQDIATEMLYRGEDFLYNAGVKLVYIGAPYGTGMGRLLQKAEYKSEEVIMVKKLGGDK